MPAAINQKIELWKGDDAVITIPVKDKQGAFVDLTGATARWWMGKSPHAKGASVWIQKNTDDFGGLEITNPSGGDEWDLVITINKADTNGLKDGTWYHEAEITDSFNKDSTAMTGPFVLHPTIARTLDEL
jgi:hypothetical protein